MIVSANADYVARLNSTLSQPQRAFHAFLRHFRESGLRAGNRFHLSSRDRTGVKWRIVTKFIRKIRFRRRAKSPSSGVSIPACLYLYLRDELRSASHRLQHQRPDIRAFLVYRYLFADQDVVFYPERQIVLWKHTQYNNRRSVIKI